MIILPTWAMDLFKSLDEINSKLDNLMAFQENIALKTKLDLLENELHKFSKKETAE